MNNRRTFLITLSRKGLPCMWEKGGGLSNTGEATIIAGKEGERLTPIHINKRGSLACSEHALIPIEIGMYIVIANHHRSDFVILVYRIDSINSRPMVSDDYLPDPHCNGSLIADFRNGEWSSGLPDYLGEAINSASAKARHFHCRSPYFVKEVNNVETI